MVPRQHLVAAGDVEDDDGGIRPRFFRTVVFGVDGIVFGILGFDRRGKADLEHLDAADRPVRFRGHFPGKFVRLKAVAGGILV